MGDTGLEPVASCVSSKRYNQTELIARFPPPSGFRKRGKFISGPARLFNKNILSRGRFLPIGGGRRAGLLIILPHRNFARPGRGGRFRGGFYRGRRFGGFALDGSIGLLGCQVNNQDNHDRDDQNPGYSYNLTSCFIGGPEA